MLKQLCESVLKKYELLMISCSFKTDPNLSSDSRAKLTYHVAVYMKPVGG